MKSIIETLYIARCELKAMYENNGIINSSVIVAIDSMIFELESQKNTKDDIILFLKEAAEWNMDFSSTRLRMIAKQLLANSQVWTRVF